MENKKVTEIRVEKKFYTAFVFWAQDSITKETVLLHCTHKYLGMQGPGQMREVWKICNEYFCAEGIERVYPQAVFNKYEKFGKDDVLLSYIDASNFFPDLRDSLDPFREDDFPEYKPHITITGLKVFPEIIGHFQCYGILSGKQLLAYWRNPVWIRLEKKFQNVPDPNQKKLMGSVHAIRRESAVPAEKFGHGPRLGELLKHVGSTRKVLVDVNGKPVSTKAEESPKST